MYLLDADTLIRAHNVYYPPDQFPVLWEWLVYQGAQGNIKIPIEQYDEITAGNDWLAEWLGEDEVRDALRLEEDADADKVNRVVVEGYANDLTEADIIKLGRDPFLISYALDQQERTVVSFETRANKQRANKKVPNVCEHFGIECITLFDLLRELDFSTTWTLPE